MQNKKPVFRQRLITVSLIIVALIVAIGNISDSLMSISSIIKFGSHFLRNDSNKNQIFNLCIEHNDTKKTCLPVKKINKNINKIIVHSESEIVLTGIINNQNNSITGSIQFKKLKGVYKAKFNYNFAESLRGTWIADNLNDGGDLYIEEEMR